MTKSDISQCRGLTEKFCSKRKTCKYACKGKIRQFCRKRQNTVRSKHKYYSNLSPSLILIPSIIISSLLIFFLK